MKCTNCNSENLYWSGQITKHWNAKEIVDGRLRIHDLEATIVLGCEECSETLKITSLSEFLEEANKAFNLAIETIEGLSDQQAMYDDWYEKNLEQIKILMEK